MHTRACIHKHSLLRLTLTHAPRSPPSLTNFTHIHLRLHQIKTGGTSLHVACRVGEAGIAQMLMAHGADPRARYESMCIGWLVSGWLLCWMNGGLCVNAHMHTPLQHTRTHLNTHLS